MATLTLEDIVDAIRVRRTSIQPSDLQKCLEAHGFVRKAPSGGSSHEHWQHPCGAAVGVVDSGRKTDVSFDTLEDIRDALTKVHESQTYKACSTLPAWLTDERLGNDGVNALLFGEHNRYVLLMDKTYPECMVVMETSALEQRRYISELQRLRSEVQGYTDSLHQLGLEYDITREVRGGSPELKVNGSGVTVPLLKPRMVSNDVIALNAEVAVHRYEALAQAESAAIAECVGDNLGANRLIAVDARQRLAKVGCGFERVEHVLVAVIPEHLSRRLGKAMLACHMHPSRDAALRLLTVAQTVEAAYKQHIGKQVEILQDLQAYGCHVDTTKEDSVLIIAPDGAKHTFGRDAGGCVDVAELRQLSHQMRGKVWQDRVESPAESALPSR